MVTPIDKGTPPLNDLQTVSAAYFNLRDICGIRDEIDEKLVTSATTRLAVHLEELADLEKAIKAIKKAIMYL